MKLCTKVWLSMSSIRGTNPTGPQVITQATFNYRDLPVMLTLSDIFMNKWCKIHEHIAPVSKRAIISSLLGNLTVKLDNFNFAYSKFDIVWSCS